MANDFKNLLLNDESIQRDAFWGQYKILNSLGSPGGAELYWKTQIQSLQLLESSNKKSYTFANKFLSEVNQNLIIAENLDNQILEETESKMAGRLIQILNIGLFGNIANPTRMAREQGLRGANRKSFIKEETTAIIAEAKQLLEKLNISEGFSNEYIQLLEEKLMKSHSHKRYVYEKAELAEQLLTEILNAHGLKTLTTGSWTDKKGKQLIEDTMTLDRNYNFPGGTLKVKINGELQEFSSIGGFLDAIQNLTGSYKVQLSDEFYDAVLQAQTLMGQVKSGQHKQSLLNVSKEGGRNTIALNALSDFFDPILLWSLYQKAMNMFNIGGASNDLDAYANLALSRGIGLTNLKRNQLYLTEYGIQSASQWLATTNKFIKFLEPVNQLNSSFWIKKRPYGFIDKE